MDSPKKRMLNAYRGIASDYIPCAPEFWYYYPAKVLGISMVEFQRDVPHYVGMIASFKKFGCEGWGIASPIEHSPYVQVSSDLKKISQGKYRDKQTVRCRDKEFTRSYIFSDNEPFWGEEYAVTDYTDARTFFDAHINDDVTFDLKDTITAHEEVDETFLLEFDLGLSFFDYFEQFMGFEQALYYFIDEEEAVLHGMLERYIAYKTRLAEQAVMQTPFEAFFIGCSSSCNALLGPSLWRKWDKVYEKAMTDVCHSHGRLIHNHNHGKIRDTLYDLKEIGFDCVCPFERPPGDITGQRGIEEVRKILDEKTTFNGNVHTVKALIQGTPDIVRQQVKEIKQAYYGSNRLIVGTGDQVGAETLEENIWAMIDETRK